MAMSRISNVKNTLSKCLVLLFSIAAASCFVWKASQRNKGPAADAGKSIRAADEQKPMVTDEEVRAARETMLRSSKSGIIMSEEDTRKMLEEQLEQRGNPAPQAEDLAPSSKVMRIVSPEEIKEVQKKNLLPSQPPEAEQSIPKESR
ncbi:MAG: hypothetical protein RI957_1216 [Verrucomicrobiota bacterium]